MPGARPRVQSTRDVLHAGNAVASQRRTADYVFITFVVRHLPHGLIGLLIAAILAAAMNSKAGELNALASTTMVDFYRPLIRPEAPDAHYVRVHPGG